MAMTFGGGFAAMAFMMAARDAFLDDSVGGFTLGREPIKRKKPDRAAPKHSPFGSRAKRGKKPKALRFR